MIPAGDFAIVGRRRVPCCDGSVKLSEEDRSFVAECIRRGEVAQLLRRCRTCGGRWHLLFDRAELSGRYGYEAVALTWEEVPRA